jgi:ABC-2 type transport system permease protein
LSTILLAVFNETYKRFLILWDYKFNLLMQLVMVGFIFVGASFFIEGGQLDPKQLVPLFIGYIVWFYARIIIMTTGADLVGEAQAGTLEQMYMSPVSAELLLIGRMFATLITTTVMVVLTGSVLLFILRIQIPLHWEIIPVLLLTLFGLFGFTLLLSGAALVFKQVDGLADLVQNALLFLTGSLLPISRFPAWLGAFAKTLPITQGIVVLRQVDLDGQSLASTWSSGSLAWLVFHSVIYMCVGWAIFKWCEHIAKQRGSLSQY